MSELFTMTGGVIKEKSDYTPGDFMKAFRKIIPKWYRACHNMMENARKECVWTINKIAGTARFEPTPYVYRKVVPPNYIKRQYGSMGSRTIEIHWVLDDVVPPDKADRPYTEIKWLETIKVQWIDGGVPSTLAWRKHGKLGKSKLQAAEWAAWALGDEAARWDFFVGKRPKGYHATEEGTARRRGRSIVMPDRIGEPRTFKPSFPDTWHKVTFGQRQKQAATVIDGEHVFGQYSEQMFHVVGHGFGMDRQAKRPLRAEDQISTFKPPKMERFLNISFRRQKERREVWDHRFRSPRRTQKDMGYPIMHVLDGKMRTVEWRPYNVIGPTFAKHLAGPQVGFPITKDAIGLFHHSPAVKVGLDLFFDEIEGKRRPTVRGRPGTMRTVGRGLQFPRTGSPYSPSDRRRPFAPR